MTLVLALLLQDVDTLLKRLGDEDPRVRDEAMESLQLFEPGSVELDARLQKAAPSSEPEVRVRLGRILTYRRLARLIEDPEPLLNDLTSDDPETCQNALYTMMDEADSQGDSGRLLAIASALLDLPSRQWLARARQMVVSDDRRVRALTILGAARDADSIPLLLRTVKGDSFKGQSDAPLVGIAAAAALGEIGSADAVPSLLEVWKLRRSEHKNYGYHTALPAMLIALGRIGDERARPLLIDALTDREEEIRYAAAEALGMMGHRDAVRPLLSRIDDVVGFPLYDDGPAALSDLSWNYDTQGILDGPTIKPDATVREAVVRAVAAIAGKRFDDAAAVRTWWAEHQGEFP